ncbi:MAG TPA: CbtA family protein [Bauldia sp.]|nr:CbtA family protein [Bauldia sp.]
MVGALLVRGMIVGLIAGILAFGFARIFGEPGLDSAIALEESAHAAAAPAAAPTGEATHGAADREIVSRDTQAGLGLFTGVIVYGAALGGLFALVYGFAYGRITTLRPRTAAAAMAAIGFLAVAVVPMLKYPANPPSVGSGDTIGYRTALFWVMLFVSLGAVFAAAAARQRVLPRFGPWNASLAAGAVFIAIAAIAMALLPSVDEVPDHFPAPLLWQFRMASLGTQAVLWIALGIGFGFLTERRWPRFA